MEKTVKIISIEQITNNVRQYRVEKPDGYDFIPGQATEVSINQPKWKEEKRPFTFTGLQEDPYLEFTIKSYTDHTGVTNQLNLLKTGDELIIRDVWGAIKYEREGYFIAGGAGITPFIAILRKLYKEKNLGSNRLFFSNKTEKDIILRQELENMLGKRVRFILTEQPVIDNKYSRIDEAFLKANITDFTKTFYVCGPDKMISEISQILLKLGANVNSVIFEK